MKYCRPIVESKSNDELADVVEEIKDPWAFAHGIEIN